jgi:hypothetical protein
MLPVIHAACHRPIFEGLGVLAIREADFLAAAAITAVATSSGLLRMLKYSDCSLRTKWPPSSKNGYGLKGPTRRRLIVHIGVAISERLVRRPGPATTEVTFDDADQTAQAADAGLPVKLPAEPLVIFHLMAGGPVTRLPFADRVLQTGALRTPNVQISSQRDGDAANAGGACEVRPLTIGPGVMVKSALAYPAQSNWRAGGRFVQGSRPRTVGAGRFRPAWANVVCGLSARATGRISEADP